MLAEFNAQFAHPNGWPGHVAGWLMALKNRERNAWAIELLDVCPIDNLLEIGFGPGWAVQQLAALAVKGFVAGVDSSETMLEQASRRNAAAMRAGRVELRLGLNTPLPYPEARFDKAFAVNSTQFWPDLPAGLRELHRVLRPDGRVVLTYQPPYGTAQDAQAMGERLIAHLRAAGFQHMRLETRALKPILGVSAIGIG
jgi:ubiquinone/menaquinone biosynthesis C-methylase UbiE